MKKLSIISIAFLLLSIGCEKESTKIEKNELTVFDLKVQELGIGETYNLPTIKSNPNNNFEAIGILHNYGCDLLSEKLKKVNFEKGFDKEAYCLEVNNVAKSMNMEMPYFSLEKIPFECIVSKNNFVSDENLNQLLQDGLLTENIKASFIKLRDVTMQCATLEELQNKIIILENEFLNDKSLNETEKQNIMSACAIARYSSAYWVSKGVIDFSSKTPLWLVMLCDAVGGVIGGTATLGWGVVVGWGCSVLAAEV